MNNIIEDLTNEQKTELFDALVSQLERFAANTGIKKNVKSKSFIKLQNDFMLGAITALDLMQGRFGNKYNDGTAAPAGVYFSIMRGDIVEKAK